MTEYVGSLLNRDVSTGRVTLRAQTDSGRIVEVRVDEADEAAAGELRGGSVVRWTYRGGRAYFDGRDPYDLSA